MCLGQMSGAGPAWLKYDMDALQAPVVEPMWYLCVLI